VVSNVDRHAGATPRTFGCLGRPRTLLVSAACTALLATTSYAGPEPSRNEAAYPVPATGQVESYRARRDDDAPGPVAVPDDGALRAGAPLGYRDNGDGTITDLTTELTWEKKCSGCGSLHDTADRYRWSGDGTAETVWDWLDAVNAEGGTGFGGYSDWRIPNVTELMSIVDYGAAEPAVSEAFRGGLCEGDCRDLGDPRCSCTERAEYWSSTTFPDFPAHAYAVFFELGLVNDRVKSRRLSVRAVRGGR